MNKEQLITIFIGLLVGGLIAGGYFAGSRLWPKFANKEPEVISLVPKAAPKQNNNNLGLTITTPEDFSSTTEDVVTVSGQAPLNYSVVVYGPADEKIASTSANGSFSVDIDLEDGDNEITITAVDQTGQKVISQKRVVIKEIPQ